MTNIQSIIGLFIVLVVILSMGLQFSFFKEGFNNNVSNKVNNSNKNNDNSIPIHSKKNNSIAKHNMLDETTPNY
jgi:regulatory protein YycI of two-component signal transduction system YycFG